MTISDILVALNSKFKGKKTYYVAAAAILTAVGTYLHGDATLMDSIDLVVMALFGTTFRSALGTALTK